MNVIIFYSRLGAFFLQPQNPIFLLQYQNIFEDSSEMLSWEGKIELKAANGYTL